MDIEQHDYIIIAIIAGIIFLQIYVFTGNLKKIKSYKSTIEKANNFDIVEVTVPEDWIKNIEVEEILRDPEAFRKLSENYNGIERYEMPADSDLISDEGLNPGDEVITEENKINNTPPTQEQIFTDTLEFPEEQEEEEIIVEEYEGEELEFEDDEEETYEGPLKSVRNTLKKIIE